MSSNSSPIDESTERAQANSNILAALVVKADLGEDKEIVDCIRAYKLKDTLTAHTAAFKLFKRPVLIKTLAFLNVTGIAWTKWLKPKLVHELICRIENLLIDDCSVCGETFATGLEDKLLLQCELCGQNYHNACLKELLGHKYHDDITKEEVHKLINPLNLVGFHYLCSSCSNDTIPSELADDDRKATRKVADISTGEKNDNNDVDNMGGKRVNNDLDNTGGKKDTGDLDTNLLPNSNQIELTKETLWRERDDVCYSFLKGECPHGISGKNCKKFHPRICNRYRKNGSSPKYGCNKGQRCTYFHPDICPNSLRSHTCFNQNCTFRWHLPHTARIERDYAQSNWYNRAGNMRRRTNYDYRGYEGHSQHVSSRYDTSDHFQNVTYDTNFNSQQNMCNWPTSGSCDSSRGGWERGVGPGQGEPHAVSAEGTLINHNSFSFLAKTLQETVAEQLKTALQQIPSQIQADLSKIQMQSFSNIINQSQQTPRDHLLNLTRQEQTTQSFTPGLYPMLPHSVSNPHLPQSQTYDQ